VYAWQKMKVAACAALGFPRALRLPLVGNVDNRFRAPEAQLHDTRFGQSEGLPFVMEIVVDGERSLPAGVGQQVDRVFFSDQKKLSFNVSFACGKPQGLFRRGLYGDPRSHWFNVFFGYYQIDVSKRAWGRPFGYQNDGITIAWEDIVKIGKSDWNYFSNWMYGVPDAAIEPTNTLHDPKTRHDHKGRRLVNGRAWDELVLDNATVVSAYDAGRTPGPALVDRELWSFLWRASYGFPLRQVVNTEPSFFPVPMKANLYMFFRENQCDTEEGEPSYQTFLFGGTINQWFAEHVADDDEKQRRRAFNEDFLQAQMRAVERVMRTSYADLGFSSPTA
jgi:hypothetical protein